MAVCSEEVAQSLAKEFLFVGKAVPMSDGDEGIRHETVEIGPVEPEGPFACGLEAFDEEKHIGRSQVFRGCIDAVGHRMQGYPGR